MSSFEASAARLRGGFVGALSAAAALAGHGLGGAEVPTGPAMVLLLLGSALIGALAGLPGRIPVMRLSALLLAGQGLGHLLLTAAGHHQHPATGSPAAMLLAHLLAAVVCAVLIVLAEHGWRRIASAGRWLVLLVGGPGPDPQRRITAPARWTNRPQAVRTPVHTALSRRGPPPFAFR